MAPRNPLARDIVSVGFSTPKLAEAEAALADVKNGLPRAMAAAINKTLAKSKTMVLRGLTKHLTIKRKNLARRVWVRKASAKNPNGRLRIMGREVGLVNFKHKDTRIKGTNRGAGVIAEVVRGTKIKARSAFVATGKFSNTHIFQREGKKRLPIKTVFSQRLYDLFLASPVKDEVERFIPGDLDKQLDSQIDRFLSQSRK